MRKYFVLLLLIVCKSTQAQPPNNSIFFGGRGDGEHTAAFALASSNIFRGSTGDGAGNASNNVPPNPIFRGGAGDGMQVSSNAAVANNIFSGSSGDGFSNSSNGAVSNNIFIGSRGDGFSNANNIAVPNSIFKGGGGDGWHAVILPLGPLPVKLLSFTAEDIGNQHLVKWVSTEEINTSHYEVQRSADGSQFTSISQQAATASPSQGASYSFTVNDPWFGNNFYRLKMVDRDGSIQYSPTVLLREQEGGQLSMYPNPTADILYIKLPISSSTEAVKATLWDAQGKLVMQTILKPGAENGIVVQHLPAGVYTIHCVINKQPYTMRFLKQ